MKKIRVFVIAVLALASTLSAGVFVTNGQATPNQSAITSAEAEPNTQQIKHGPFTPEDFATESGSRSAIAVSAQTEEVTVKRGERLTVPITFTHIEGQNPFPTLTVVPLESSSIIYPPSVANSTTEDEKLSAMIEGRVPQGTIPERTLYHIAPASVSVDAGESKTAELTIMIPKGLPDEMVGHLFFISPQFDIVERSNSHVDGLELFTFGIKVTVSE